MEEILYLNTKDILGTDIEITNIPITYVNSVNYLTKRYCKVRNVNDGSIIKFHLDERDNTFDIIEDDYISDFIQTKFNEFKSSDFRYETGYFTGKHILLKDFLNFLKAETRNKLIDSIINEEQKDTKTQN